MKLLLLLALPSYHVVKAVPKCGSAGTTCSLSTGCSQAYDVLKGQKGFCNAGSCAYESSTGMPSGDGWCCYANCDGASDQLTQGKRRRLEILNQCSRPMALTVTGGNSEVACGGSCPEGMTCNPHTLQCFFDLDMPENGWTIPFNSSVVLWTPNAPITQGNGVMADWSGKLEFHANHSMDGGNIPSAICNGLEHCPTYQGVNGISTAVEFTFVPFGPDYYDVSVINGMNVPIEMRPDEHFNRVSESASGSTRGYNCGTAGALHQADSRLSPCSWHYKLPVTGRDRTGKQVDLGPLLTQVDGGHGPCTSNSDCTGKGHVCGQVAKLSPGPTAGTWRPTTEVSMECGNKIGLWSVYQLCVWTGNTYTSSAPFEGLIDCPASHNMFACADSEPWTTSCYHSVSGAECCGCANWTEVLGKKVPDGGAGCQGSSSEWLEKGLPYYTLLKDGCPTTYTYAFDDETSTFTCQTAESRADPTVANDAGYVITLCPSFTEAAIETRTAPSSTTSQRPEEVASTTQSILSDNSEISASTSRNPVDGSTESTTSSIPSEFNEGPGSPSSITQSPEVVASTTDNPRGLSSTTQRHLDDNPGSIASTTRNPEVASSSTQSSEESSGTPVSGNPLGVSSTTLSSLDGGQGSSTTASSLDNRTHAASSTTIKPFDSDRVNPSSTTQHSVEDTTDAASSTTRSSLGSNPASPSSTFQRTMDDTTDGPSSTTQRPLSIDHGSPSGTTRRSVGTIKDGASSTTQRPLDSNQASPSSTTQRPLGDSPDSPSSTFRSLASSTPQTVPSITVTTSDDSAEAASSTAQPPSKNTSAFIASFNSAFEIESATEFDVAKFTESVAASQEDIDAESIEVLSVSYEIKVQYSVPDTMTETQVREAIAASQGISAANVNVVQNSGQRRLGAARRLDTSWDVTIKTSDAAAVSSISEKAADVEAVKAAAEKLGIVDLKIEVAAPPKQLVKLSFKVKSKPDTAGVVPTIDASKLADELGNSLGIEIEVGQVELQSAEEVISTTSITADLKSLVVSLPMRPVTFDARDYSEAKRTFRATNLVYITTCFVLGWSGTKLQANAL
eukprot:TRINITY_DN33729_c0_g1_i1.p1 TRINITY_DN33729_c0_g1~~TRINITY_DN33729_c0_g1_i1.p1  ORF type:complete len:1072 (+),score=165.04 TRINITY_DN33729_c0_g1_i1:69-3284(+)